MTAWAAVRHSQAVQVLADLDGAGKRVSPVTILAQATARYAGEHHRAVIDEVADQAMNLAGIRRPEPPPVEDQPPVDRAVIDQLVEEQLVADPAQRAGDILEVVRRHGRLPIAEASFRQIVYRTRKRMGCLTRTRGHRASRMTKG